MIKLPTHLYLTHIKPKQNMQRFYALSIEPNLFGEVSLIRTWGRIGSKGQIKTELYQHAEHAQGAMSSLLLSKQRKGYDLIQS